MKKTTLLALAVIACTAAAPARAQDYPSRPIAMIVPYAAGGSTDGLARIVADAMGRNLGQTIVVENIGGGGTVIGTQRVTRAAPDGYTITFGNMGSLAIAPSLYPKAKFDPRRDMKPIGLVATVPMVISASNASGLKTLGEFLQRVKARGNTINIGNAGSGSTSHIGAALLLHVTGTQAMQVPYRGAGPAIADLMAGTVDAVIDQTVTMIPLHQAGRVRALAVASPARLPQLPDVPTFAEAGVPQFDMSVWNGLAAPAGTPDPVIDRLAQALAAALASPEVRAQMARLAAPVPEPAAQGPAPFGKLVADDLARFAELIAAADIHVN